MTADGGLLHGDAVERLVFATTDAKPSYGPSTGSAGCRSEPGSNRISSLRTSVGTTLGVRLHDGRRVVVKAHEPRQSAAYLRAVVEVQRRLVASGFPCPRPLLDPVRVADGFATVEELVDDGEPRGTHPAPPRRELGWLLARLLDLMRPVGAPPAR